MTQAQTVVKDLVSSESPVAAHFATYLSQRQRGRTFLNTKHVYEHMREAGANISPDEVQELFKDLADKQLGTLTRSKITKRITQLQLSEGTKLLDLATEAKKRLGRAVKKPKLYVVQKQPKIKAEVRSLEMPSAGIYVKLPVGMSDALKQMVILFVNEDV